ncbi:MAG: FMN-binding protein [Patescibacteria group bacterium]|nr:FMN-binding protein [Patescibacteria group bacterium]MDE1943908.1 FMN-binding protein [Patescibacteria group bacterium]MDE1944872.1 FMN-binding protein [Patescibacteria group bacterium]MDE2057743.1 FMN-binding protein [Patescibacteria group bacterium]
MKKFAISLAVVLASAGYVLYQGLGGPDDEAAARVKLPPATAAATPAPAPAAPPTPAQTPATTPAPKPAGQYADGTYTGSSADAYYGMVQVRATVAGGKVTNVTFLSYPSDRSTSRYINGQAMPYLSQEAIQAQNANVDIVSGATDTSLAFRQSLASALAQAKG